MVKRLRVVFMPWAGVEQAICVGAVTFWPWRSEAERMVPDAAIRGHLNRVFEAYVAHNGRPVKTVTVCSHGRTDFRDLNDTEVENVLRARRALFFASFCKRALQCLESGATGLLPPTADLFAVTTREFEPGNNRIAVVTRSRIVLGPELGQIRFAKPFALGGGPCPPDAELIQGLNKALGGRRPKKVVDRLFQALEWFRLAHIEEGEVSEPTRVVTMATAFELLLRAYGKKGLAQGVDQRVQHPGMRKVWRLDKAKNTRLGLSKAAAWIWDFYNLRSAIVHGRAVAPNNLVYAGRISHLAVADMLFWQLVKLELFRMRCIGKELRRAAARIARGSQSETPEGMAEFLGRIDLLFQEVHKALGWVKPLTDLRAYQNIRTYSSMDEFEREL
ncbi:hypothetical protein HQ563_17890 [bacterium]|nr:hypothetical protein [bacterium]